MRPNILFAIADDWSHPHAGVYGDRVIKTPTFDQVAREGVLFTHAFCAAPTCTASRGAALTGQAIHRLDEGANLWSTLSKRFAVYPDLLEEAGYFVGYTGKGWGPGSEEVGGWDRNPAGPHFESFERFLRERPPDAPFCFWYGSHRPHRPYEEGAGLKSGMKLEDVAVPPYLPDTPEVRSDILDYYCAAQRYDSQVGGVMSALDASGLAENTMVVVTSDNGWPFPRGKCEMYDAGTRMPLAVRWPGKVEQGRTTDEFVGFTDFAPTFLEAAGLKPPAEMTGRSLLELLLGNETSGRDRVFLERERHTDCRPGKQSYPIRAVRTKEFLYVRNLRPHLWPAGDPELEADVRQFADIDWSPTKEMLLRGRDDEKISPFFESACGKRPAEELYDLAKDPWQITNVADRPEYAGAKKDVRATLDAWMEETADPRAHGEDDRWDRYPYIRPV